MTEIQDSGEHLPYAKKETMQKAEFDPSDISLKKLWPEPNWKDVVKNGTTPEAAAHLAMIYQSIRPKPRSALESVTDQQWQDAYINGIDLMKMLFAEVITIDDIKTIETKYKQFIGYTRKKKLDLGSDYHYFATGGGSNRTVKSPFNMTRLQRERAKWLSHFDWPISIDYRELKVFPIERNGVWHLGEIEGKNLVYSTREQYSFKTLDKAIDAIKKKIDNKQLTFTPKKPIEYINTRKDIDDISTHAFMDIFRFRGVQFGNSLTQNERQLALNNTFHAFYSLAKILNINPKWIGLGGLGIAFGARGEKGLSSHYESDLNIINLSRRSGAGSIAFEWFHALDRRLAKSAGFEGKLLTDLFGVYRQIEDPSLQRNAYMVTELTKAIKNTKYHQQSRNLAHQKGGREVWLFNSNIIARVFEAYIQDLAITNKLDCDWLAFGTLESDYPEEFISMHPYPIKEERKYLTEKIDELMSVLFR